MARSISGTFTIILKGQPDSYTIEASGPKGTRVQPQPFSLLLLPTQQTFLNRLTNENARISPVTIQEIGHSLYKSIFTDQVLLAFGQAQGRVGAKGLRLRLDIEPPELADLPWEAMYDGQEWLAAKSDTPLVRTLPQKHQIKTLQKLQVRGALKILFVGASPIDRSNLDVENTAQQLQQLLKDDIDKKRIVFDVLINAALEELRQQLVKEYHILYFAGHGSPDGIYLDDGEGGEIREGETVKRLPGDSYLISAQTLAQALEGKPTRLVFLAACNTGAASNNSGLLSNFAQELAGQARLPGLVAMQYSISDIQASQLTSQFFAALAAFHPVDVALAEARKALVRQEQVGRDVISPVMYLQAEDGGLFRKAKNWAAIGATVFAIIAVIAFIIQFLFFQPDRRDIAIAQQTAAAEATGRAIAEVTSEVRETARTMARATAEAEARQRTLAESTAEAESQRANIEQNLSRSRELAAESVDQIDVGNYDLALLLAIEAGYSAETVEALSALRRALKQPGRTVLVLSGHQDRVTKAQWSPDESRILTISEDDTVRVWDAYNGSEVLVLQHKDSVTDAEWNTDGTHILTAAGNEAKIWNAETGDELFTLPGHPVGITQTKWDADESHILTAGAGGIVRVWDAKSGVELSSIRGNSGISQVAWSPDANRFFALSNDGSLRVWDTKTMNELFTFQDLSSVILQATWSKDNSHILTSALDNTIRLWDVESGLERIITSVEGVNQAIWNIAETRILTANKDGTATVLDAETGLELMVLNGHSSWVTQAMWNADETLILTISNDGIARIWDAATGSELLVLRTRDLGVMWDAEWSEDSDRILMAFEDGNVQVWSLNPTTNPPIIQVGGNIDRVFYSPDEKYIAVSKQNGNLSVWDTKTAHKTATLSGFAVNPYDVSWNPRGTHIVAAGETFAKVWNVKSGTELLKLEHNNTALTALWFASDNRILTSSWSGITKIWDGRTGVELFRLEGRKNTCCIIDAKLNADQSLIMSIGDQATELWDAKTGDFLLSLPGRSWSHWNKDETAILTASDNLVRVWDAKSGDELLVLENPEPVTHYAAWNSEETLIMTASDKTVWVWDVESGALISEIIPSEYLRFADWHPKEDIILTVGKIAEIWNAKTGARTVNISGHKGGTNSATWNSDGSQVLTAGKDGTARVWDLQTGTEVSTLSGHSDEVIEAKWFKDEKYILTVGSDGTIYQYYTQLGDLIDIACKGLIRNLTQQEWEQFMGNDEPYRETCPGK